jgi:hypothetical protein
MLLVSVKGNRKTHIQKTFSSLIIKRAHRKNDYVNFIMYKTFQYLFINLPFYIRMFYE